MGASRFTLSVRYPVRSRSMLRRRRLLRRPPLAGSRHWPHGVQPGIGVPAHVPSVWQTSSTVQGSPSSHGRPGTTKETHPPSTELQVVSVQGLSSSSQITG
jgi:hypothetical protein